MSTKLSDIDLYPQDLVPIDWLCSAYPGFWVIQDITYCLKLYVSAHWKAITYMGLLLRQLGELLTGPRARSDGGRWISKIPHILKGYLSFS